MIINKFLIYIESNKLILLREKMVCIECGGEILFQDKVNFVDVKCHECGEEYKINYDGLWHLYKEKDRTSLRRYIEIKHLNRLRI